MKMKNYIKSYSELKEIESFLDRFEYLKINGKVGEETFGSKRQLNQILYKTKEWKNVRDKVIIRDNACDLGSKDRPIFGKVLVHHINPISIDDILERNPKVFDLNNLVCVSHNTHEAIHYSNSDILEKDLVERKPNDTCLWKH